MKYYEDIDFLKFGENLKSSERWIGYFSGYYGLQYTHSGNVELTMGAGPTQKMAGPALFLSAPGEKYLYMPPPGETRHHVFVCFQGNRVNRWRDGGLLPAPGKLISIANGNELLSSFHRIFSLVSLPGNQGHDRAVLEAEQMLLLWCAEENPRLSSLNVREFEELAALVREHPEQEWDFEQEARRLHCSYSRFRLLFRQHFGCPPGRYLLECRLNLASELLLNSGARIREVALQCGFGNEFYFSRIFRKYRRMTPSAYRR